MDFMTEFPRRSTRRRTSILTVSSYALAAVLGSYLSRALDSRESSCMTLAVEPVREEMHPATPKNTFHSDAVLSSAAGGARFRDSLVNGTRYMTTWTDAGWTNNFMSIVNMIYLATLTDRVPILPPFMPLHVGHDAPAIPFGEVFDIPSLAAALGRPLLEWRDVKSPDSDELETLGCWSVWDTVTKRGPRPSTVIEELNLDVSYTRVPDWVPLGHDDHVSFWKLAKLSYSDGLGDYSAPARPSPELQRVLHPDDQLMCFDLLYYVGAEDAYEWQRSYSPAWRNVATHLRWTPRVENIGNQYLRATLGLHSRDSIPPYIALHIRHGDFNTWCAGLDPDTQCFAPLVLWKKNVDELRLRLKELKGMSDVPVIVTSDETRASWWDEVAALGWHRLDHAKMRTAEQYGKWYPVFIDAVIQAGGIGFLGTLDSTMSLLALRRVQDWRGGIGHMVKWNIHNMNPDAIKVEKLSK